MEQQHDNEPAAVPGGSCGGPDQRARERLLRAAADVFDRKGYSAASVREIVEQAGITKPVLYYHYGSKEGILLAILQEGARQFQCALSHAVASPGTTRERLAALCAEVHALFKQNVPVVRVAHAIYFGPREGLPAFDFNVFDRTLEDAVRTIVEDGVARGDIRAAPVEDVTIAINGVLALATDAELNPHARQLGVAGIHRVLDLIFEGLLPKRDTKEN